MSKAFSDININTSTDDLLFNRSITNTNQNNDLSAYTQFDSKLLDNSLQLLEETNNLTIEPFNNFVDSRSPSLNTMMDNLPIINPTTKPMLPISSLDFSQHQQHQEIDSGHQYKLESFSKFVQQREPSLNTMMDNLPIINPTAKPILPINSLDFSQNNRSNSTFNTSTNTQPNSTVITSNIIDKPIEQFQTISNPHIPYDKYDKASAYFNNFHDNGRSDIIREYVVHINSSDRDILRYPSPFNFLVKCAPLSTDTNASISRKFENVRYLKLETAIIPIKYYLKKTDITSNTIVNLPDCSLPPILNLLVEPYNLPVSNTTINYNDVSFKIIYAKNYPITASTSASTEEYINFSNKIVIVYCVQINDIATRMTICYETIFNKSNSITTTFKYEFTNISTTNDKYSLLYLNDINDISSFSTNKDLSNSFNILYPDLIENNSLYVDCTYVEKIYKYSNLGNLNQLLINMTNSMGKQLTINKLAQDTKISNIDSTICTCTTDANGDIIRDYKCICTYIRHPRYIYNQINLMFKVGVIETDMNIRAFN